MKKSFVALFVWLAGIVSQGTVIAGTVLNYDNFSSTAGYTLHDTAFRTDNNEIQMTTQDIVCHTGGVFFTTPVDVTKFSTSFTMQFTDAAADGLVFVIKNPDSWGSGTNGLGGAGEQMGYATRSGQPAGNATGIGNSVGIEFDTYRNSNQGDPDAYHIGVNTNASVTSLTTASISPKFSDTNNPWYVWVDYDGAVLSVSLNQENTKPGSANLVYGSVSNPFVIKDVIGTTNGMIGFTASTGGQTQTAVLKSFNHNSPNPEPSTYVLMGVGALIAGLVGRRRLAVMSTE